MAGTGRLKHASVSGAWLRAAAFVALAVPTACSLLVSPGDLDAQYGRGGSSTGLASNHASSGTAGAEGTGGSVGSASSASTGGSNGGSDAGQDGGDGGCPCVNGCDQGRCVKSTLESPKPNGIGCGPQGVYVVASNSFGLIQHTTAGQRCRCIATTDPGGAGDGYEVAVGNGQVVWRTFANGETKFWSLPDADCCAAGPRTANLVATQSTSTNTSLDFGNGIATDGTSVVWLDLAAVKRATIGLPDAGPESVVAYADAGSLDGLAVTSTAALYNLNGVTALNAVNLYDGGGGDSWPQPARCRGIQSNGQFAAWAILPPGGNAGEIHGMSITNLSSANPTLVTAGFTQPAGLAIDQDYVYVADSAASTLSRVAIAAPNTVDVLWSEASASPSNTCVDTTFAYWLTNAGLLRVEKSPP